MLASTYSVCYPRKVCLTFPRQNSFWEKVMAAKNTGSSEQNKAVQDNRLQVRKVLKERQKKVLRGLKSHEFPLSPISTIKKTFVCKRKINWDKNRNMPTPKL